VEDNVRQVEFNTDRLQQALKAIEEGCSATDELRHQVRDLKLNGDDSRRRIQSVAKELQEVKFSTEEVKGALKEQSSILLPNIHLGSDEAAMASERHGSLLASHTLGRKSSAGKTATPRMSKWT
jgi:hypothetical protein